MNRENTPENYAKQVGLTANNTKTNMSLYSDTIFTDREPTTERNGRRSSTKMQDQDEKSKSTARNQEKDGLSQEKRATPFNQNQNGNENEEEQGAGVIGKDRLGTGNEKTSIKRDDVEKPIDSTLGKPVDYAPVTEADPVKIQKEELPMMSEGEEKVVIQPQKKEMPKPDKDDKSNDLSIKKEYVSRRARDYDDTDSADEKKEEDDVESAGNKPVETGVISYRDTKGNVTSLKPNIRFLGYKNIFKDLLKQTSVVTMYPILSMIISYDSTKAITLTKKDDRTCFVK